MAPRCVFPLLQLRSKVNFFFLVVPHSISDLITSSQTRD